MKIYLKKSPIQFNKNTSSKTLTVLEVTLSVQDENVDKDHLSLASHENLLQSQKIYRNSIQNLKGKIKFVDDSDKPHFDHSFKSRDKNNTNEIETKSNSENYFEVASESFIQYIDNLKVYWNIEESSRSISQTSCLFSLEHYQSIRILVDHIECCLSQNDVHIVMKVDDESSELENFHLDYISHYVQYTNCENRLTFATEVVRKGKQYSQLDRNIEITPITEYKILVIYLNRLSCGNDWHEWLRNSQDIWEKVGRFPNFSVQYCICPNKERLERYLSNKSYNIIIVQGHGEQPNDHNFIYLTPDCIDDKHKIQKVSVKDLNKLFKKVNDLEIVCLLSCNSDNWAKNLLMYTRAELVFACDDLLAISIIPRFEQVFYNEINELLHHEDKERKIITWVSIFQCILDNLRNDGYTSQNAEEISSHSMRIYQRPNIFPIFKSRTFKPLQASKPQSIEAESTQIDTVRANSYTKQDIPSTDQYKRVYLNYLHQFLLLLNHHKWITAIVLFIPFLSILIFSLLFSQKPSTHNSKTAGKSNSQTTNQAQSNSFNSVRDSHFYVDKLGGGFLISKKKIQEDERASNTYFYYGVVYVNNDIIKLPTTTSKQSQNLDIFIHSLGKISDVNIEEIFNDKNDNQVISNSNSNFVVISFKSSKDIQIPKFIIKEIAVEHEVYDLVGYELKDSNNQLERNYRIKSIKVESKDQNIFSYSLSNKNENIGLEYIGSPILHRNNHCILGSHKSINASSDSNYQGILARHIYKLLKSSGDDKIRDIAMNMKQCYL